MNQFDFAIGNGGPSIGSPPYSFMLKFVMHWLCFLVQRHPTASSPTRRSPVFAPAAPRVTRTLLANPRRLFQRFADSFAEGRVGVDGFSHVLQGQTADDGLGELADHVRCPGAHHLGAEDFVGAGVCDDFDEAALLK